MALAIMALTTLNVTSADESRDGYFADAVGPHELIIKLGKDGSHSLHAGNPESEPLPSCTPPHEGAMMTTCTLFKQDGVRVLDTLDINVSIVDYEFNPECTVYVVTYKGKEYYYYSPPECAP